MEVKEPRYIWATAAEHKLGDISRDKGDIARVDHEEPDAFIGAWVTGFGFIKVRFPKATSREASWMELAYLDEHPVVIV